MKIYENFSIQTFRLPKIISHRYVNLMSI